MAQKRILALSSSRVGKSAYLETSVPIIKDFLGNRVLTIAFIPFAAVDEDYEKYLNMVREGLKDLPHYIVLATPADAKEKIKECDVIMIGGGNTFKLLHNIYYYDLFSLIVSKVNEGTPYIGWSAGGNIAGRTIGTTNDMPIIEPQSFKAFNFFPFQINPHYINEKKEDHNGETRDQRLEEFTKLNAGVPIVALPEGSALLLQNDQLKLIGHFEGVLFYSAEKGEAPICRNIAIGEDLSYLLKRGDVKL